MKKANGCIVTKPYSVNHSIPALTRGDTTVLRINSVVIKITEATPYTYQFMMNLLSYKEFEGNGNYELNRLNSF